MKLYLKFGYPSPPPNTRFGRGLPAWQIQRRSSIHRYPCTMNSIPAKGVAGQKSLRSACDLCHQGKVKCSGGTPCDGCDRLGVRCIYSTSNRTGRPKGVKNKKTLERIKQLRAANLEDNDSPSSQYVRCDSIDFFLKLLISFRLTFNSKSHMLGIAVEAQRRETAMSNWGSLRLPGLQASLSIKQIKGIRRVTSGISFQCPIMVSKNQISPPFYQYYTLPTVRFCLNFS